MEERKWAMLATSVRGANAMAFAAGVLMLVAACGSSPQMPTAGPTTLGTPTSSATRSPPTAGANGPTSTTASSTPTSTPAIPPASTSAPTALVPPSRARQVVNRLPTNRKVVALTFDAGGNGDGVNSILATLTSQKVAASFFLTGHFTASFPALVREMAAAGRVGNHTADHPHLPTMADGQVRRQVTSARAEILRATGQDPRPLFRFPFGDSTPADLRLVNDLGYVAVGWTVHTLGWQGTSGGRSVSSVFGRVLTAAVPGEIVLMHVGSNPGDHSTLDADSLPRVISGLRAAGYGYVTLDALGTG
jgi:peptidoglycan/xylan/chitin deacetylase (PgdA/CDA1 family)